VGVMGAGVSERTTPFLPAEGTAREHSVVSHTHQQFFFFLFLVFFCFLFFFVLLIQLHQFTCKPVTSNFLGSRAKAGNFYSLVFSLTALSIYL
jgi:hypothetical protein